MSSHRISSPADMEEFKSGIENYTKGVWFSDRWKTFRLRFGIYEQRQSGQHMIRAKSPGGHLDLEQARAIAKANADFGGGDIHITTRQGVQFYFVKLEALTGLLETLNQGGMSTREASGNTFRAIIACPEAGFCSEQHLDAADVAGRLTKNFLRNPMVQHMPRKFKISVSGCERDCGLSRIDDLGFIATVRDGERGFHVVAGGGLGIQPMTAITIFDFVTEQDLPRVQEAVARLHIKSSSRTNKNRARIKFLVRKFGAEDFIARVHDEYKNLENLAGPAWGPLEWGAPNDNGENVEIDVPLGWLSSAQMDSLADLTEAAGGVELRLTRTQNIIVPGLIPERVEAFVTGVRNLGFDASGRDHVLKDLVVCPGTATCAIGITDSHALGESLVDAQAEFAKLESLKGLKFRVSGCHNSCAQHHIADVGLHGLAKKIDGQPAPHYQLHLGGDANAHGITGPVFAVRRVKDVLKILLPALAAALDGGESVRSWAERLGKDGLNELLAPVLSVDKPLTVRDTYDLGSDHVFTPPATSMGECAAGAVVAEHLSDMAFVARADAARLHRAGRLEETALNLRQAVSFPAQRLLVMAGKDTVGTEYEVVIATVQSEWAHNNTLMGVLDRAIEAISGKTISLQALPALMAWQTAADIEVERLLVSVPGYLAGAAE